MPTLHRYNHFPQSLANPLYISFSCNSAFSKMPHEWNNIICSIWGVYNSYLNLQNLGKLDKKCGDGNGTPLQYSCLENPMDRGAWWAAVHGVAKSRTRLSNFTFTFNFHALEKEMATHSSVLIWRIPGMGEPGGLPSMGSNRVGHDWSDLAAAAAKHVQE